MVYGVIPSPWYTPLSEATTSPATETAEASPGEVSSGEVGWQTVAVEELGASFDLPADWNYEFEDIEATLLPSGVSSASGLSASAPNDDELTIIWYPAPEGVPFDEMVAQELNRWTEGIEGYRWYDEPLDILRCDLGPLLTLGGKTGSWEAEAAVAAPTRDGYVVGWLFKMRERGTDSDILLRAAYTEPVPGWGDDAEWQAVVVPDLGVRFELPEGWSYQFQDVDPSLLPAGVASASGMSVRPPCKYGMEVEIIWYPAADDHAISQDLIDWMAAFPDFRWNPVSGGDDTTYNDLGSLVWSMGFGQRRHAIVTMAGPNRDGFIVGWYCVYPEGRSSGQIGQWMHLCNTMHFRVAYADE